MLLESLYIPLNSIYALPANCYFDHSMWASENSHMIYKSVVNV